MGELFSNIIWFIRAGLSCILLFVCFVSLFPVQLIGWAINRKSWSDTMPYLYLDYLFAKGVASPGEHVPDFDYWKKNRFR